MKFPVGADTLNDVEIRSFAEAIDVFRGWPLNSFMPHSAPIRDDSSRLCEVRFYADSDGQKLLGVVPIGDDAKPGTLRMAVYRWTVWDSNDNVPTPRYATREAIERIARQGTGAATIEGTETEVDVAELDGNGFWTATHP